MYKCYLFDFDGTLVDSMPVFASSMLRILDENGVSYSADIVKIITPLGLSGTANYFLNQLGLQMSKEALMELMKTYFMDAYFHTIPAKDNVISVLKELKSRGASLNVLTASPHAVLDKCLERLGRYDLFENVWSCDDFATTKADPQIYKRAAAALGKRVEECMFVDDNVGAVSTAKKAGMIAVGIYDDSSKDLVAEMTATADIYIYDFSEL